MITYRERVVYEVYDTEPGSRRLGTYDDEAEAARIANSLNTHLKEAREQKEAQNTTQDAEPGGIPADGHPQDGDGGSAA